MIDRRLLERVDAALEGARAAGVIGSSPIERLMGQARGYLRVPWLEMQGARFVDCGTGSGILGIVLALEMPMSTWTLVDSNERRCDLARRAVTEIGIAERVTVEHARIEELARRDGCRGEYDGAVARMLGPPEELAECALPLLKQGGCMVVSVSAATRLQWQSADLLSLTGCETRDAWSKPFGNYLAIHRVAPAPDRLPRRLAARRRSALM